jgi:Gram-negative bacterial TonB protein C-terminal
MKKLFFFVIAIFALQATYAQASLNAITPIPFEIVENQPIFPGGNNEFIKFVGKNFRAPGDESFTGGVLKVTFVIETNGQITGVKVINDLGFGTAEEIKRVLALAPKWTPGDQNGQPTRVLYTLPITIRI